MVSEEQRKARLGHLDAAEFQPPRRMPFPGGRPAIAARGTTAAWPGMEQVPHERTLAARIMPLDRHAEAPPPSAHRAVRAGLRQRLDHRLHDFIGTVGGAERHRRPRPRPDHGAFLRHHGQRPEGTGILRHLRIQQVGECHRHRAPHVRVAGIDEAHDLGRAATEIDSQAFALLGHAGMDQDILGAVAVIIEPSAALEHAILPGGDDAPRMRLGMVEDGIHPSRQRRAALLVQKCEQPALAQMRRTHHGQHVAAHLTRQARVGDQHVQQVRARGAALAQPDRRDAQPLLPDFGGAGVVAAMGRPADIGLVRAHHRPEAQHAALHHRHNDGEVRQVAAAVIGVVEQENVALTRVREGVRHGARGKRHRPHMHRDVVRLRHQAALRITQGNREIAR